MLTRDTRVCDPGRGGPSGIDEVLRNLQGEKVAALDPKRFCVQIQSEDLGIVNAGDIFAFPSGNNATAFRASLMTLTMKMARTQTSHPTSL